MNVHPTNYALHCWQHRDITPDLKFVPICKRIQRAGSTAYPLLQASEMENGTGSAKDPSGFLSEIIGNPVTVKLNSGVVYKGTHVSLFAQPRTPQPWLTWFSPFSSLLLC